MLVEVGANPETVRHLATALTAVKIAEAQASGAFAVFCSERGLPATTQLVGIQGSRVQVLTPDEELPLHPQPEAYIAESASDG